MKEIFMRKVAIVVSALALVLLGGVVAYATIPDGSGVIHGCRKNSDGSVRVIDSDLGQTCMNGWTPLNWNQAGPQGPAGAPGGVSGYEVVRQRLHWLEDVGTVTQSVACPAGKVVTGAGYRYVVVAGREGNRPTFTASEPSPTDQAVWSWTIGGFAGLGPMDLDVSVVCVNAGS